MNHAILTGKNKPLGNFPNPYRFPFQDLISRKKKDKRKRFDPHWSGIGFGFCNAMGRGMKFLDSPTGISLDFSGSFEIFWNFVTIFTPIHRDNWGFITGIGLDWRNYVMNDNRYFTKQNGQIKIVPCPEDAHLDFSRLKTVDLTIPLFD